MLNRFIKASFPFFEKQAHDLAIFEQHMALGHIVIIPGADYNTFLSHPELVEERMQEFMSSSSSGTSN
jgi:hypothetical protein